MRIIYVYIVQLKLYLGLKGSKFCEIANLLSIKEKSTSARVSRLCE